ncbi:MAG TPA: peptide MFS transporter [Gemmatimonadales bacterium]|nr:peptide MFS transporter [Gemmatimonadales bacterium]
MTDPIAAAAGPHDRAFFGHPRGLSTLFFTEMWERFSYYGMRAILILFMTASVATGGLGFDAATAGAIYGTYVSMVYITSLPGGWLADRFLGQRRATLYGGILIMLGHISLAFPALTTFYLGLGLVVLGTGLLKPNISTMVGGLYTPEDERRDAGFSLYYTGINTGAFIAPLVCGWLAQSETFRGLLAGVGLRPESAWHWGFGMAAIGMFFGLVQYLSGWKHLGEAGMYPAPAESPEAAAENRRTLRRGAVAAVGSAVVVAGLALTGTIRITAQGVSDVLGIVLILTTIAIFVWMFVAAKWTPEERRRLVVVLVLFVAATIFWSVFEQAGSTLNLFAQRSTRTEAFGMAFPPSWLQSVAPFSLVVFSPVFAWIWTRLGTRDPSSPAKFTIGLVCVALSFAILVIPAQDAQQGLRVSPMWLVATYLLHTFGELCLSPVGLSAMTRLAPARIAALTMGVWFVALSFGNYLGGRVAGLYESFSLTQLFGVVAAFAALAAVVLALLIKPIRRMLERSARPG